MHLQEIVANIFANNQRDLKNDEVLKSEVINFFTSKNHKVRLLIL